MVTIIFTMLLQIIISGVKFASEGSLNEPKDVYSFGSLVMHVHSAEVWMSSWTTLWAINLPGMMARTYCLHLYFCLLSLQLSNDFGRRPVSQSDSKTFFMQGITSIMSCHNSTLLAAAISARYLLIVATGAVKNVDVMKDQSRTSVTFLDLVSVYKLSSNILSAPAGHRWDIWRRNIHIHLCKM